MCWVVGSVCFHQVCSIFWCSFFNSSCRSWKRSETRNWSQYAIAKRTVFGRDQKKKQSLKTCSDKVESKFYSYINLPASHIKIFWNRSRYTLSVQNRELRERLSSEYWVRKNDKHPKHRVEIWLLIKSFPSLKHHPLFHDYTAQVATTNVRAGAVKKSPLWYNMGGFDF